jgi:hypothetical protein
MEKSDVASWSPARLELLKEIEYRDVLGDELKARIESIVSRNEITPAVVKQEIDTINGRLQTLRESVNRPCCRRRSRTHARSLGNSNFLHVIGQRYCQRP